ncbi:MAG TPA: UrcA family protein [Sphingomicrobium sp.]
MTALRIILASALITTAVIKAVPAVAEPVGGSDVNVSIVHTADLNLSTDAGRRALDVRLAQAAREVCGSASDADLAGKNKARACRANVLADARAKGEQLAVRGASETITLAAR